MAVPPASYKICPGYGGLVMELEVDEGDIRALFIDVSVNYGYLATLDDNGPTLVYSDVPTEIASVNLGEFIATLLSPVAPPVR